MYYLNKNVLKIVEVLDKETTYFNSIYERTGIKSKNNLLKNLNNLVEQNVVKKEKTKSNTYYFLNKKNPITIALLNLTYKIRLQNLPFAVRRAVIDAVLELPPKLAVLFGSYAKGGYTENSDIDLVFFDSAKENYQDISNRYGVQININLLEIKDLQNPTDTLKHILKTGYPIIGGEYLYRI